VVGKPPQQTHSRVEVGQVSDGPVGRDDDAVAGRHVGDPAVVDPGEAALAAHVALLAVGRDGHVRRQHEGVGHGRQRGRRRVHERLVTSTGRDDDVASGCVVGRRVST